MVGAVGAEEVAGGDLRDGVGGHEGFGLGALADAGSSEEEDGAGMEGGLRVGVGRQLRSVALSRKEYLRG